MIWKYKQLQQLEKMERAALITALFVILGLLIVVISPYVVYQKVYAESIYPGVAIDGVEVGKMTKEQAQQTLEVLINNIDQQGIQFSTSEKTVSIKPTSFAVDDPDLTYEVIRFNVVAMVDDAYSIGRSDSFFKNIQQQIKALAQGVTIPLKMHIEKSLLNQALALNFPQTQDKGMDARVVFVNNQPSIIPEQEGKVFDFEHAIGILERNFSLIQREPIPIRTVTFQPAITKQEIEEHLETLTEFLRTAQPLTLTFEGQSWEFPVLLYREYLEFKEEDGEIVLRVDPLQAQELLKDPIKELTIDPQNAEITFNDEKTEVVSFSPQKPGRKVNVDATIVAVNTNLFNEESPKFSVAIDVITAEPEVTLGDLNELGIKEIIGVGTSEYSGSPVNRRHNVEVGRKAFNGVLLAPGEEFSALGSIGEVNAASGYLPELVIKGNETIPEYGGGLCQVSTTMFRAALDAGLEITQRRNHSYTVRYYEPIGTDATIYDPAPDFRFRNDTGHHILIHTINDQKNSKLIYEIWGTRDGRLVEMTKPVTYDWVAPPPTKIIETTDLPVGVKKCTESAHAGVKAYFDRIITLPDGTKEEERFHSTYRPWQAVCLVGVEELTTDTPVIPEEGGEESNPDAVIEE